MHSTCLVYQPSCCILPLSLALCLCSPAKHRSALSLQCRQRPGRSNTCGRVSTEQTDLVLRLLAILWQEISAVCVTRKAGGRRCERAGTEWPAALRPTTLKLFVANGAARIREMAGYEQVSSRIKGGGRGWFSLLTSACLPCSSKRPHLPQPNRTSVDHFRPLTQPQRYHGVEQ